jgi:hypothetical protein
VPGPFAINANTTYSATRITSGKELRRIPKKTEQGARPSIRLYS